MVSPLDDYRWLVSAEAAPWLAIVEHAMPAGSKGRATVQLVKRLRQQVSPQRAHLLVEQVELRLRAAAKFARAGQMFFTRKGLEQATDDALARYKAARFERETTVADLCCGIGGDLVALAKRGPACGVDRDPVMALLARANAAACGIAGLEVAAGDALAAALDGAAWHCDPDRRPAGRRSTRGELFEPPLESLAQLLDRRPTAAIKLAPATEVSAAWAERAEREWLGSRGECRQQVAWFGELARHAGQHAATVVEQGRVRTVMGIRDASLPVAAQLGRYVFEPHAAVLAARLTGVLCEQYALATVAPGIAYLTGDVILDDLALAAFLVEDALPLDRRQLRAYCRERSIGQLEIKKRGVQIDPERLRREIAARGDRPATLIVAPVAGQACAIVVQRIVAK